MSRPQEINDYITAHRPATFCDNCVASAIGMKNIVAHPAQITAALGTTSDFIREHGKCSICEHEKTVIRAI